MDNRKKLAELIEELKIPMDKVEFEENSRNLTEREIELLLMMYEEVKNYRGTINGLAHDLNPSEAEKIDREYQEKIAKIDEEYKAEVGKINEDADARLDETDREELEEAKNATKDIKSVIQNFNTGVQQPQV